jgi:hypothetical protein
MSNAIEQLIEERDARLNEIKLHRGHIDSLEDQIGTLAGQVKGLETAINILQKNGQIKEEALAPATTPPKYDKMSLTDAIIDVIDEDGDPPGLLPAEIVAKLIDGGFKSNAKSLYQSVYGVCLNLIKTERIYESKKQRVRAFVRKE